MGRRGDRLKSGIVPARNPGGWWQSRWCVALVLIATMVPLLYPSFPPLVDVAAHMGRYRVELDLAHSSSLQQFYDYHWAPIGNLGVDALVKILGPLLGLEPAVKLIVVAIPLLTAAGMLWIAREVHGRIPPTGYFALPFAYAQPFLFGFVNFALAMALALLAFALWLRLGRTDRTILRAILFVPISVILFFCHAYGWGVLGLLCFAAGSVRQRAAGRAWIEALWRSALSASALAAPLAIMLAWRGDTSGVPSGDWLNLGEKIWWLKSVLRDRWYWFDLASVALVAALFVQALRDPRLTFARALAVPGLTLVAAFVLLPQIIFGSAYADMRLTPYMIAILLLAVGLQRGSSRRFATLLAIAGLSFCVVRFTGTTISLKLAADDQEAKLAALEHVPHGARVATFVGAGCIDGWAMPWNDHLGSMVIVRREGFANDQWIVPGVNLLDVRYRQPGRFASDPSQTVRPNDCQPRRDWPIDQTLAELPAGSFDYLWLIDPPRFDPKLLEGNELVWRSPGSSLYRIKRSGA